MHLLTGDGMDKSHLFGVEALSFGFGVAMAPAIHLIARYRMTQIGHVHPNLMGTSRFELQAEMGISRIFGQHFIMGTCRFGMIGGDRHSLAFGGMPTNGSIYRTALLF